MKKICALLLFFLCSRVFAGTELEGLRVDITPFIKKGCKEGPPQFRGYLGELDCTSLGLKEKFGISSGMKVPNDLGGLRPAVPIIEGYVSEYRRNDSKNKSIRMIGCRAPQLVQYVVYTKGRFRLIDTPEAFRSFFAPVNSGAEAYSFAVALTGSYPIHKINIPAGMFVESPFHPRDLHSKIVAPHLE